MSEPERPSLSTLKPRATSAPEASNSTRIRKEKQLSITGPNSWITGINPELLGPAPEYYGNKPQDDSPNVPHGPNVKVGHSGTLKTKDTAEARRRHYIRLMERSGDWGNHDYIKLHTDGSCWCDTVDMACGGLAKPLQHPDPVPARTESFCLKTVNPPSGEEYLTAKARSASPDTSINSPPDSPYSECADGADNGASEYARDKRKLDYWWQAALIDESPVSHLLVVIVCSLLWVFYLRI